MKSYLVTVCRTMIRVDEHKPGANRSPEFVAIVDGVRHQYFVKRGLDNLNADNWRELAGNQAYYHALNSGNYVVWQPVTKPRRTRKKKISEKQGSLF